MLFLFTIALDILGLSFFHMNFQTSISRSVKNVMGLLMGSVLKLYNVFENGHLHKMNSACPKT